MSKEVLEIRTFAHSIFSYLTLETVLCEPCVSFALFHSCNHRAFSFEKGILTVFDCTACN